MMVKELIWRYKKGMNAAKSHYCARLSRLRLTIFVEKSCIDLSEFPSKGGLNPLSVAGHWLGMQSEPLAVDISSERESPVELGGAVQL